MTEVSEEEFFIARQEGKATLGGIANALGLSEQETEWRFNAWEKTHKENLPAVVQTTALEIPVADFEGEFVRIMYGKIPAIRLPMDYGYGRGTHLKLELEVRVRSVLVDEVQTGKNKGDLFREHAFAIEEAKIIGVYTQDEADPGVGGGLAATGNDIEDEESDSDDRPETTEGEADDEFPDF